MLKIKQEWTSNLGLYLTRGQERLLQYTIPVEIYDLRVIIYALSIWYLRSLWMDPCGIDLIPFFTCAGACKFVLSHIAPWHAFDMLAFVCRIFHGYAICF